MPSPLTSDDWAALAHRAKAAYENAMMTQQLAATFGNSATVAQMTQQMGGAWKPVTRHTHAWKGEPIPPALVPVIKWMGENPGEDIPRWARPGRTRLPLDQMLGFFVQDRAWQPWAAAAQHLFAKTGAMTPAMYEVRQACHAALNSILEEELARGRSPTQRQRLADRLKKLGT